MKSDLAVPFLALLLLTTPVLAAPVAAGHNAADAAFLDAMNGMMAGMHEDALTGDTDLDFARMMLPHHQAAIDMAKAEIQYGKDPEMKALASAVVAAQAQEVGLMNAWLAKHAK